MRRPVWAFQTKRLGTIASRANPAATQRPSDEIQPPTRECSSPSRDSKRQISRSGSQDQTSSLPPADLTANCVFLAKYVGQAGVVPASSGGRGKAMRCNVSVCGFQRNATSLTVETTASSPPGRNCNCGALGARNWLAGSGLIRRQSYASIVRRATTGGRHSSSAAMRNRSDWSKASPRASGAADGRPSSCSNARTEHSNARRGSFCSKNCTPRARRRSAAPRRVCCSAVRARAADASAACRWVSRCWASNRCWAIRLRK